jgi:hypothetical protein
LISQPVTLGHNPDQLGDRDHQPHPLATSPHCLCRFVASHPNGMASQTGFVDRLGVA